MQLQICTDKIREKLGQNSSLQARLKFDCASAGVVFVDAISTPHVVDNVDREADCTVSLSVKIYVPYWQASSILSLAL